MVRSKDWRRVMTNEDIIKELTRMWKNFDPNSVYGSYCVDCLDAAIEALKEQPEHSQNTSSKQPDVETLGIKTGETCEDVISRQDAIDVILSYKIDDASLEIMTALGEGRLALTLNDACDRHIRDIEKLPSAQSKQLQVLADVLDGCPLTQPCDRMWRGGWCEEHCKNNKLQKPNAECWLKYAEVMAERKCDGKNQSDL